MTNSPSEGTPQDRMWIVERTWLVYAPTANEAMRRSVDREPDHIRTYEGPPRPWPEV